MSVPGDQISFHLPPFLPYSSACTRSLQPPIPVPNVIPVSEFPSPAPSITISLPLPPFPQFHPNLPQGSVTGMCSPQGIGQMRPLTQSSPLPRHAPLLVLSRHCAPGTRSRPSFVPCPGLVHPPPSPGWLPQYSRAGSASVPGGVWSPLPPNPCPEIRCGSERAGTLRTEHPSTRRSPLRAWMGSGGGVRSVSRLTALPAARPPSHTGGGAGAGAQRQSWGGGGEGE